jgi:autotransporter-associated beta strand protein
VVPAGGSTVNALTYNNGNYSTVFTDPADVLNLTSGALVGPNQNTTFGGTANAGRLTAGGTLSNGTADLYIYNRANTWTLNSQIIDNLSGAKVRAVFSLGAPSGNIALAGTNAYSGGTVVNAGAAGYGTLNLAGAAGSVVIPAGGLTLNGANVTMLANEGQIDPSNLR